MKTENYILNSSEFIPHWFEDVQTDLALRGTLKGHGSDESPKKGMRRVHFQSPG